VGFLAMLFLALGLAMDSFSVSVCCGTTVSRGERVRTGLKVGLVMGGFQAAMPVMGWLGGSALSEVVSQVDHWVAFGLLAFIGGRMIWEGLRGDGSAVLDPRSWGVLLSLGVATSIDALAVGLSLAILDVSIIAPAITIGIVAFALSWVGVSLGCEAGTFLRQRVPILGGAILCGLGLRILVEHLSSGVVG